MTTCSNCGRHVEGTFPFCPYCRAELVPAPPSREQRKRVTILFCDVTGSTALGESTDPEALRAVLARYFGRMKGIIESHGGTVEKFIGDAVMAVFGVPTIHEDDALRAVRAAAEMQAALPEIGITCRIGVNSGEVVTGTAERLATGDAVNVAARLEQAAAPGEVLLGKETVRLVRDAVGIEVVPPLELKGKSERVPAYRLVDLHGATERRQLMTTMVGRIHDLERLRLAFTKALDDRSCQLFTILGSAGVGKSRLSYEFLNSIDQGTIVRGRCLSYGEGITYFPVVETVKQLGALPSDEYAAAILQTLLGEKSLATSPEEIAWAFRSLLEEQAQDQPLIVLLDDIHWGEETFLDLVEHVADLSRDAPILLLCMARSELLEKRPGWGGGKWNATTALLEPLNGDETNRLLDALGGVSAEMGERIRAAAEGNPLFVEEMLALMRESGNEEATVPPTIQALLAARLDQLNPADRSVLECGSVEGRVFHKSAVQVLAREENNLQGKLLGLVRKELIRPERARMRGDEAYRFRHLLIRDAAYDALPKAVRAELHERFAGWLDEHGSDPPELDEIAGYHLEQAARYKAELGQENGGVAERAGERLARAGKQALWREDRPTARGLLERALMLLRPLRWDTYLELNFWASLDLHVGDALARLEEIADRAEAAGDRPAAEVARVLVASGKLQAGQERSIDELEARAQTTIRLLEVAEDHEGLIHVWHVLGYAVYNERLHYENWAHATEQMILHARAMGRPGLFHLPMALAGGPRPADEALRTLDSLPQDDPHPSSGLGRAALLAMLGRSDEAQREASAAHRRILELNAGYGRGLAAGFAPGWWVLAQVAVLAGDQRAAVEHLRTLCDRLAEDGRLSNLSTFAPLLGRELCALGRYNEAEPLALQGRELGAKDDILTQTLWRQVLARVLAHRAEDEVAELLAREAVALLETTDVLNWKGDAYCDLAEVLEKAGKRDEAIAALNQALELYAEKRNLVMAAQVRERRAALSLGAATQVDSD
ncbi:MAG: adenylate/guanylate cyclase domain-containing protein [Chloroflexota bacterium]